MDPTAFAVSLPLRQPQHHLHATQSITLLARPIPAMVGTTSACTRMTATPDPHHSHLQSASHSSPISTSHSNNTPHTSFSDPLIRPLNVRNFSLPFGEHLVIRAWEPRDALECVSIISDSLIEHGLSWEDNGADNDVVNVPHAYSDGEFWVVEDVKNGVIVGTAAFYAISSLPHTIEIRKMYLRPSVRRIGLGSFLLRALEQRVVQLGFKTAIIETASVLRDACTLYSRAGYQSSCHPLHTDRCDQILEKDLTHLNHFSTSTDALLEIVDRSKGWRVVRAPRTHVNRNRLLFRAVVVLVQQQGQHGKILVHRRSRKKSTFPGRMAALVTGCCDWGEDPAMTARREVFEEVGIDALHIWQPFEPFIDEDDSDDHAQRILFHPFVATGHFDQEDIVCCPAEVDEGFLMSREEIQAQGIGGSLWAEFRLHGL